MTSLQFTAPQIRNYGPASGSDLATPSALAQRAVRRAQPAEKIHEPTIRTHGREASQSRARRAGPPARMVVLAETARKQLAKPSSEHLSPVAKFGDSAPALTQLIAHENGFLRAHMPKEITAFSRQSPSQAYQATLDRTHYIMRDILPHSAAA